MKYNATWKKGYAETVEYAVASALDAVGESEGFTLREFADGFGFKVTYNLRRRIRELVEDGKLDCKQRYLNNGRLGYIYYAPKVEKPLPWTDDETEQDFLARVDGSPDNFDTQF